MKATRLVAAAALAAGLTSLLQPGFAQLSGLSRTDLLKQDLSIPGRETIQTRVAFAPGTVAPAHVHPGEEIAYVLEGTLEYQLDGGIPITVKAGQSLFIPAGSVHSAKNVGSGKATELATYIVDKSKPLLAPAP